MKLASAPSCNAKAVGPNQHTGVLPRVANLAGPIGSVRGVTPSDAFFALTGWRAHRYSHVPTVTDRIPSNDFQGENAAGVRAFPGADARFVRSDSTDGACVQGSKSASPPEEWRRTIFVTMRGCCRARYAARVRRFALQWRGTTEVDETEAVLGKLLEAFEIAAGEPLPRSEPANSVRYRLEVAARNVQALVRGARTAS
jgi:hypothetical protein